ncbi:hypothetical protein AAZX31_05G078600 [Glycine max]|uniref:DUF4005 domain-containing protein n=3 Tax=Glycine subgen. Soja TaxID=1462606 RepID=K7KNV1_SOYBN|nr:protein IQ-DOMAIN 1 isoform X1 [Glycine max]XP_006579827.1 protein IQ-DOMAIN 1 isoform X1 [Glycine max]XP_025984195.1 protein IQ-DOMAIN 1 isoform X1 [Glycine max]XP_028231988.1 protein IQ-DOMAIN 1-like isoform X2 [Glycine soja]XP_028231989.1 protein IQ-DOMAIN 1-like isoform X2 [Glycine soja]KAG5028606.1 hypothetical protein JHK87_012120 [Glycine soja]KAG5040083.1 hypothetical protein JHK85_012559 [Glycine max]KAG5057229.1 hypothetical protein JHK86_012225 [Glycine max]KAH1133383.1 hypoth|eukprot:XP_006579826.1 protein IQ-DOMAIN 1 isoform X2 [Glycine max]
MGKKGSWFSAVKKVFSSDSKKDKKKQKSHQSKKASSGKDGEAAVALPPIEDVKLIEAEKEQSKHAASLAFATAIAAEAAVAAAQAAAKVVRLTSMPHYTGKTKEEIAVIKIQTAFRGYMARRALRALRGLVRLKTLQGQSVKRQAASTLRSMQTLARLQSQIRESRIRMSEENQALQHQLPQKHEKELEKLRAAVGEEWDDRSQLKEQIEAKLLHRQEAALRRERALAYSFSHQQTWKGSSKSLNPTFMDPNNPKWGWSWLERWMATRPRDGHSTVVDHNDHASVKSAASRAMSVGEITKLCSLQDKRPSPFGQKPRRPAPQSSPSKTPSTNGKARPSSSKGSSVWGGDEGSRSMFSVQSERYRRHSIAGSSVRDDESLASSPAIPSYMAPTSSAKARSKIIRPSPEKGGDSVFARKRLSFSPSSASRRHSDPPKVEMVSNNDAAAAVSNGRGR